MDKAAISAAQRKYSVAAAALKNLEAATKASETEPAWEAFIHAFVAIYKKLEKGAKKHPQSNPWFGSKKHQRAKDPLLNYIFQARNSDQHGFAPVTKRSGGSLSIRPDKGPATFTLVPDANGKVVDEDGNMLARIALKSGTMPIAETTPAQASLIPVYDDRSNIWIDPPTSHMGTPLANPSVIEVAALGLSHLHRLIDEADQRSV